MTDEPINGGTGGAHEGESVKEAADRLRKKGGEAAEHVADKLETSALGTHLYADVLEVSQEEVMEAVEDSRDVRQEFNRMVGGHEHEFGVELCRYFDHVDVREGPNGPEPVFLDREPTWKIVARRVRGAIGL